MHAILGRLHAVETPNLYCLSFRTRLTVQKWSPDERSIMSADGTVPMPRRYCNTFSSLNTLNVNKKSFLITFQSFSVSENVKKEFSIHKSLIVLTFGIAAYYVISIFFGAPIFENYSETLYFSVLMSVLTVYPLLWYFFFNDSLAGVLKVISDSKFDNSTESHLHSIILWTVIGAWVGAFPIPLDWDRPWQKWPITCCIGASLGNSVIHLIIGFSHVYNIYKDKRKTNRPV
ncbi:phosphatidylinositol-glycan biosynthesis class F protein [Caerostris darwini]|uniref:Phosphatidylinositol-glycan biosynthesis class F protein n=1 Tax=Caerostris darwini TaxID=1538125 RepID=A0AAV4QNA2_9ARAC|nr:phosphatidylinositol-glycan biosynthesis class F protein [Caerostris darwini]